MSTRDYRDGNDALRRGGSAGESQARRGRADAAQGGRADRAGRVDRVERAGRVDRAEREGAFGQADGSGRADGRGSASRTSGQAVRSRDARSDDRPVAWKRLMGILPDNVWVNRVIAVAVLVVLVLILAGLVRCVGGAFGARSSEDASSAQAAGAEASASAESASASASASDGASSQAAATLAGVDSQWIESGKFSTGDSALDSYIKQLCDTHSKAGATFDQNAYDTYLYVSQADYVERENNQSPWGGTWDVEFAKQFFEEGDSGNCYNYAAVTEFVLKYFGYSDAEAEPCVVRLESGAWGDHGLVFVTNKVNGQPAMIDDALSADGWMLGVNDYDFDVRNIGQNSTIKGNVEALENNDTPTPIPPGELTEKKSDESERADADGDGEVDADSDGQSDDDADGNDDGADGSYAEDDADEGEYGSGYGDGYDEESEYDDSAE